MAGRRLVVPERFGEGLVVAQVHYRRAVRFDAVAQRHRRMMEILRNDPRTADVVRSFSELPEVDGGRKLADLDGEVRELHLTGKNFGQRMSAPFWTADGDLVPGNEERGEEGEALDVIPMRVAEQDHRRDGLRGVCHELRAQRASTRPAVEYETGPFARRHFHARGIAAEADGPRTGGGDRPPGPPESHSHVPSSAAIRSPRGERRDTARAPQPGRECPRAHDVQPRAPGRRRSP